MSPDAAQAWVRMRRAAEVAGVELQLISGFRSISRQTEIIERKINAGERLQEILKVNAYPGFSEHHTGRALDLGSKDSELLSEAFEITAEFGWLVRDAGGFGFHLSYPRGNELGVAYEPWHWCYRVDA